MPNDEPTPNPNIPDQTVETLEGLSSEALRYVAQYAEQLAAYREREQRFNEQRDLQQDAGAVDRPSDMPKDVPSKASLTVKEINDNRYYYWQWREGEKIKSRYRGPVHDE